MSGLIIPDSVNGVPTWFSEAPVDYVRQLQEGDPSVGWEGDPRLYLRPNKATGGWSVWRMGDDNKHYCICHSKAPHKLDKGLFIKLRDNDTRRQDVFARITKQNEAAQKAQDRAEFEKHYESLDRVYHGLKKDVGHLY